ncbi:MAG: GrpB family protein [Aeromicrobium sp.]
MSDDDLEGVLIGGREAREIVLVDHDPRWAVRYQIERERILAALGVRVLRIDHIGSTSVPDLAAKPIIDIDLSVADPEDEDAYVPDLERLGYVLRVREPHHRMLRTPELGPLRAERVGVPPIHLHVCALGSEWERRHRIFRDWLRNHPDDRQLYEDVKRSLAGRTWADTNDYADAKTEVVEQIMRRATAS